MKNHTLDKLNNQVRKFQSHLEDVRLNRNPNPPIIVSFAVIKVFKFNSENLNNLLI